MSPGQTGRTSGGVPPKFFMFIGFFLSPIVCLRNSSVWIEHVSCKVGRVAKAAGVDAKAAGTAAAGAEDEIF